MAHQLKNLDIPDDLYQELQKRAEAAHVPVEDELLHLAEAMLGLNKTIELTGELLRQIGSISLVQYKHFPTVLTQDRVHELSRQVEALARLLSDQQVLDTLASQGGPGKRRHALDILAEMPGHQAFQTAEDVDRYVREERESWEG